MEYTKYVFLTTCQWSGNGEWHRHVRHVPSQFFQGLLRTPHEAESTALHISMKLTGPTSCGVWRQQTEHQHRKSVATVGIIPLKSNQATFTTFSNISVDSIQTKFTTIQHIHISFHSLLLHHSPLVIGTKQRAKYSRAKESRVEQSNSKVSMYILRANPTPLARRRCLVTAGGGTWDDSEARVPDRGPEGLRSKRLAGLGQPLAAPLWHAPDVPKLHSETMARL